MRKFICSRQAAFVVVLISGMFYLSSCNKNAPEAETAPNVELPPASKISEAMYVEGIAGGTMVADIDLVAEVVSVDQENRTVVLRGPEGGEVKVRVGKGAVNFYQLEVGDRVNVGITQELVIYVNEDEESASEPAVASTMVATAAKGEQPAGAIVETRTITAQITTIDIEKRTAEIEFDDGQSQVFQVRSDVDMTQYSVGQEVVFQVSEMLAVSVEKI